MENGTWKLDNTQSICIIGNGSWGNALLSVVSQNTKSARIAKRGEVIREEIVIIAVPTNSIRELAGMVSANNPIIINTAKGIEKGTHKLPQEIIHELYPSAHYFTLIGPGFADEVKHGMPTIVNLGFGEEQELFHKIQQVFETDTFRIRPVRAIRILELSAALKNIYAIGCGLADGLGYETNTRVQLIVLAIEEIQRLFKKLKLTAGVNSTAGTIGDLILTCNSSESRNFQFGRNLAKYSVEESLKQVKETVEGYFTLQSLEYLEKSSGASLPVAAFIQQIITNNDPQAIRKQFEAFIRRS